ncbi:MAG TPA: alcohol dehydrogenase catalytic domain-containing protein [Vicinamibacterales bacterium]|nr:alcohol dehydrogenase catalytic domain-containing protein [Vicinamibacterales bacterium]HPW21589.1 alcohol dehydrogenase catalytic domain-containing protein [Vicinamibacterales bacterium]
MSNSREHLAARLHGPRDLRVERVPHPGPPPAGHVLLRVSLTGICGSDLHSYLDARIGDTEVAGPFVIGHEFSATVEGVGPGALDYACQPLRPGARVAVDPAQPCGVCELCARGHPNLCERLRFCGNCPDGGSLCEWMHMPARSCVPVPDALDDASAALLEPLGVALHAVDLARIRVGDSAAILGAGPIGLLILQVARLAGASPIIVTDRLPARLALAERWGGIPIDIDRDDPAASVARLTGGRGVDVAIEAAWADESVSQAMDMLRLGGRAALVGIPRDDRLTMRHSTARRKGATIRLCRRMKHAYPRALALALEGRVDLRPLVTHRFPLARAAEAFGIAAAYADGVVKAVVESR